MIAFPADRWYLSKTFEFSENQRKTFLLGNKGLDKLKKTAKKKSLLLFVRLVQELSNKAKALKTTLITKPAARNQFLNFFFSRIISLDVIYQYY